MPSNLLSQPFSPNIEEINGRKFIVNKYEKIYNLCKVHNYEENDMVQVDKDNKRIVLENYRNDSMKKLNKHLKKQFNYDDLILNDEKINDKLLSTFVKRILMKHENFVVVCINKGSQKVSNNYNEENLSQLMRELYGQIDGLISSDVSLRLSSVEINENNDEVIDLCETIEINESEDTKQSSSNQFKKHRINKLEIALKILDKIHKTEPENNGRNHRIFTVNIYQRMPPQQTMSNSSSKVQCSSITWLQMNLSKQRSKKIPMTTSSANHRSTGFQRSRCVSLSSMSRYFTGSLSRIHSNSHIGNENDTTDNNNTNLHQLLNTIFFDQYAQNNFFCFLTHLSICNNDKISDSIQLLQFSGKISRLKDRLRTYKVPIEDDYEISPQPFNSSSTNTTIRRSNATTTVKYNSSELWKYVKDEKRRKSIISNKMSLTNNNNKNNDDDDDDDVAGVDNNLVTTSLSELSCVETVVFNGDENVVFKRAGCSDDESHISRKIRASFNASDSDSGCKDVRRKCLRNRPNYSNSNQKSLVWSKSALKKAHKAIMKGEETWIDGPVVPTTVEVNNDKKLAHSNWCNDNKDNQVPNYQGNYFDQISPLPISSSPCQPSLTQIPELVNPSQPSHPGNIFFSDNTNIENIIDNDDQNQTTLTRWFNDVTRLTSSPSVTTNNSFIPYAQCCPGHIPETARPSSNGYGDETFHGYHYYDANNSNNNTTSTNSITHPPNNINHQMNIRNNHCYGDDNFYGYQYYDLMNGQDTSKMNPQHAYHNQAQLSYSHYGSHARNTFYQHQTPASTTNFQSFNNSQNQSLPQYHSLTRTRTANKLSPDTQKKESNAKPMTKSKSFLSKGPLDLIKRTLLKGKSSKKPSALSACTSTKKPTTDNQSPVESPIINSHLKPSEMMPTNHNQELHYLQPIQQQPALSSSFGLITVPNNNEFDDEDDEEDDDESSEESSSESECNEWFRNIRTFKSSCPSSKYSPCPPSTTNSPISNTNIRPPSAPLPSLKQLHIQNHQQQHLMYKNSQQYRHQQNQQRSKNCNSRQRSNSSGYGSVAGNGAPSGHNNGLNTHNNNGSSAGSGTDHLSSEFSSLSDEIRPQQQNRYFNNPNTQINTSNSSSYEHLDPDIIAEKCEALVKQEKAFLLIRNQEMMISEFMNSTKKHLPQEQMKVQLAASAIDFSRLSTDQYYLDELEEDTNVIRDTIAFYKSRLHFESSFVTPSPAMSNRNTRNDHKPVSLVNSTQPIPKLYY